MMPLDSGADFGQIDPAMARAVRIRFSGAVFDPPSRKAIAGQALTRRSLGVEGALLGKRFMRNRKQTHEEA
jgi:hypothetical protein